MDPLSDLRAAREHAATEVQTVLKNLVQLRVQLVRAVQQREVAERVRDALAQVLARLGAGARAPVREAVLATDAGEGGALLADSRGGLGRAQGERGADAEERRRLLPDGGRVARVADAEDGVHAASAEELEGPARHGEEVLVDDGGRVGRPRGGQVSSTRAEGGLLQL